MNKPSKIVGMNGFSLIELMIGITLGLLIMTALVTLFVNTSRTNTEMAKVNSQIENGRFAMQLLENEIVHGGFWGGYLPQFEDLTLSTAPDDAPALELPLNTVPAACLDYASWDAADGTVDGDNSAYITKMFGIPIQAYDGVPTGCSTVVTNKKANTDVLLIRHAATCLPGVGNCEAVKADKLYFQFSQCENEIGAATPLLYMLAQAPANDDTSNFTLKKRGCTGTPPATAGTQADVRKFVSHIYYIRDHAVTDGDGIPTLMRTEFDVNDVSGTPTLKYKAVDPLINGIEGFRVELGIDNISDNGTNIFTGTPKLYTQEIAWFDEENLTSPTNRGDGSPDYYKLCTTAAPCSIDELSNVVAVKIYVLARADTPTAGYEDNKTYQLGSSDTLCSTTSTDAGCVSKILDPRFKRHVFSTTVRLNNVSSRRETP